MREETERVCRFIKAFEQRYGRKPKLEDAEGDFKLRVAEDMQMSVGGARYYLRLAVEHGKEEAGLPQRIVGFHQDEKLDWVAELECGHQQHVRHNPPWIVRDWITSEEGRKAHIGHELLCLVCVQDAQRPT